MKPVEIYLGKYSQQIDDNRTDEEKIIAYFTSLFGDDITLFDIASYSNEELSEYCDFNKYTKKFVKDILHNYINKQKNMQSTEIKYSENSDTYNTESVKLSANSEASKYSNEELRSLLKERYELSLMDRPRNAKLSKKMKHLFDVEKRPNLYWADQYHMVKRAIEIEILDRIRTDKW